MIDSVGIEAIPTFLLDYGDKNVLDFVNSHKQRHWQFVQSPNLES